MSETGGPKVGLMNIGEEAKPPFAVLPDPSTLFSARAKRLTALAADHELAPYLRFLAAVTQAQSDIQAGLPSPALPAFERIGQALEHGMPPLSRSLFQSDAVWEATLTALLDRLAAVEIPAQTRAAIAALRDAAPAARDKILAAALADAAPGEGETAQQAIVAAGLQVHFARMAAQLDAENLKPIADGVCPACGGPPMTSTVVGWPKAHSTRFCTCSLCATMWNVVRVKCVLCSSTEGISYRVIDGKPDTVKGETCTKCQGYVKILYQVNDAALEACADDVASLGLDMLLAEEGWKRGGRNPFLLGY